MRSRAKIIKCALLEGWDISVRDCAHEKGYRLRIERNRMGSLFRPYNEYRKRSRAKIIIEALPGDLGYERVR